QASETSAALGNPSKQTQALKRAKQNRPGGGFLLRDCAAPSGLRASLDRQPRAPLGASALPQSRFALGCHLSGFQPWPRALRATSLLNRYAGLPRRPAFGFGVPHLFRNDFWRSL